MGSGIAYYICKLSYEHSASFDVNLIDTPDVTAGTYLAGYISGAIGNMRSLKEMEIQVVDTAIFVSGLGRHSYLQDQDQDEIFPPKFKDVKAIIDKHFATDVQAEAEA